MKIQYLLLLLLPFFACDNSGSSSGNDFDRRAMLEHYGQHIIQPAYGTLGSNTEILKTQSDAFATGLTEAALLQARTAWRTAYESWQNANAFNFGPGGEEGTRKSLVEEIGLFPVSESKIESRIASGAWNMNDFDRDARGFLAVEYLLYGKNQSTAEVLNAFQVSPNRRQYLNDLVQNLVSRVSDVRTAWSAYYPGFVANDGTDVGSSTSLLYNEFVRSYESLKNFKVALPLGKRPGQVQPEPQLVEGFYSATSLDMIKRHWASVEHLWYGQDPAGADGPGFREYLASVEGGDMLIGQTEAQMAVVRSALAAVPANQSLSELMAAEAPEVVALNDELQKFTRFIKSDMSSLLGIAITFASGDGD
ncbi:MAG: imelysin family protein [Saprospiraceae bacterium]|nr:imelysin family protein [Saprospiraceae bacterium]